MDNYVLFVLIAIITVASPGPGVLLTVTNAIRYGRTGAIPGILGIALGTFIVAGISATSVGVILATSALAFTLMKWVGAAYLVYLGIRLWRASGPKKLPDGPSEKRWYRRFLAGISLQLTNPKVVFFFMSVFPQFIDLSTDYTSQFLILVVSYSSLVILIHMLYAHLANYARYWLSSDRGARIVNRVGGGTFMCFGIGLASASR